jgi:hypothetical protein
MMAINRTSEARLQRQPDLFLSHSSRDKKIVRQIADDLIFCEVDVWFDEWELQVGDSLHDVIGNALQKSRFIGIALGDNFSDSRWAREELKQALATEMQSNRVSVLPLLCGNCEMPPFLADKIFLDFRTEYYPALARLAAAIHEISRARIEDSIRQYRPMDLRDVIETLRYVGIEPYVVLGEDDVNEIRATGHVQVIGDRVRFDPKAVQSSNVSPRIRNLMKKLINEVW